VTLEDVHRYEVFPAMSLSPSHSNDNVSLLDDRSAVRAPSPGVWPGLAQSPFVSVIVPVRNEARFIRAILSQLVAQDYDPERFEVIVVDGESTDATRSLVAEFVERHANVSLLSNPRRWSSAGRNAGIQNARGDIVVIVDGHCRLEDDRFLAELAAAFQTSDADCVGRPQPLDADDAGALRRAVAAARSSRLGHHPDSYIYSDQKQFVPAKSVACAYRRPVFDAVGLFDETFDACEDVELNHRIDRAGLRCYFTPGVRVHYSPRASLCGLFRQMARYGRGRVRLLRKHPETLTVKTLLPGLFVAGCVAGLGLMLASFWLMLVYLAALVTYGAIVVGTSAAIAVRRRDASLLALLPLVFAAIHVGSGVGILGEFTVGRHPLRPSTGLAQP